MKKILLLFLLFSLGTLHGLAQDFCFTASGITWKCKVLTDGTVSICGASSPTGEVQELIFPTSVTDRAENTYTVTDLNWQYGLDLDFSNLTKVVLPKSLISISGHGVFSDCSLLTTIENTENIQTISNSTFNSCSSLKEIELPQCTTIGDYAFNGCNSLTSIELPQCSSIGTFAFENCSKLVTATIPQCTSISTNAFYTCCI